jgi:hypothetical protein
MIELKIEPIVLISRILFIFTSYFFISVIGAKIQTDSFKQLSVDSLHSNLTSFTSCFSLHVASDRGKKGSVELEKEFPSLPCTIEKREHAQCKLPW